MTHDPDAAERLARNLDPETSWTVRLTADDARDAAALIRAQAAEIARLTALDTPAPQPDAEEREAMVYLILDAMLGRYPGRDMARAVADALLAAGWTRKREEG